MTARVAYILKGYPRLSETFITNEIFVLEQLGLDLGLFVIKRAQEHVAQDTVARIVAPVHYLPRATSLSATGLLRWLGVNLPAYLRGNLNCLVRHPLRYPATLARAIVMGWRYRKPDGAYRKVYIKEFLQAAHIAAAVEAAGGYRQLHAHFCHGATTVAMLASRLTGLPYSFTAHAKDIYQAEQNPGDLLRVKVDGARFVATCTASNRAHLDRIAGRGSIHKIYHGLDVTRFHPADRRCNRGQGPVRILAVGRYVEKKGFSYLLEACARLQRRGLAFECRIVGESGDQLAVLRALHAELALGTTVQLLGPRAHDELVPLYQQSDVFALPCQVLDDGDRDGIPNVLVEAMASGLAVVSTRISGIPELVEHRNDGLLVEQKNVDALTAALAELIDDPGLRARLGGAARVKVCACFDAKVTTASLKTLFESCLERQCEQPA